MKKNLLAYIAKGIGILIFLFILAVLFYRYVLLPVEVRKECASTALEYVVEKSTTKQGYTVQERDIDYAFMYRYCFNNNGLEINE